MTFYRFKTFKSTYYFPALTEKTRFIYSLYGNYGGKGAHILWLLFTHSRLYRWLNRADENEVEDFARLKEILGKDTVFGINMGSKGPDQKKSILGYDKNTGKEFFAKYSTKKRAMELSRNEIKVYQSLVDTGLVPKIYDYKDEKEYVFLKCECIKGNHVHGQIDNRQVLDMLLLLKQKHYMQDSITNSSSKGESGKDHNLKTCFAHMDFCPWNMIDVKGKLHIIDWEMSAEMPLGFDLFTYLLQTYFLTENLKTGNEVITNNEALIDEYFGTKRPEWQSYLDIFVDWKIKFFSAGQNDLLLRGFEEMRSINASAQ